MRYVQVYLIGFCIGDMGDNMGEHVPVEATRSKTIAHRISDISATKHM